MDRNIASRQLPATEPPSLSARRAWIEIANFCRNRFCPTVALRKESVDRNTYRRVLDTFLVVVALRKESVDRNSKNPMICVNEIPSLSARRAWIEIRIGEKIKNALRVALRKESVDRNSRGMSTISYTTGRSPQGERG